MRGIARSAGRPDELVLRPTWHGVLTPYVWSLFGLLGVPSAVIPTPSYWLIGLYLYGYVILAAGVAAASRGAVWLRPGEIAFRRVFRVRTFRTADLLTMSFTATQGAPVRLITTAAAEVKLPVPAATRGDLAGVRLDQATALHDWWQHERVSAEPSLLV